MSWIDDLRKERHERAVASGNAILVVLPFFLTAVCIMMLVYSIVYFCDGAAEKKLLQQREATMDIINNPGDAWEEWAELWGTTATTWDELEEPFEKVKQDWESRGLSIDWEYMTKTFNKLYRKTFDSFQSSLFSNINTDFAPDVNPTQTIIIATVLLVLGIIIGAILVFRFISTGSFVGMFVG